MFNVLPEHFKRELLSEYRKRRIIVWTGAFIFLEVCLIIAWFPSAQLSYFKEKDLISQSELVGNSQAREAASVIKTVRDTNAVLKVLTVRANQSFMTDVIDEVVLDKGTATSISVVTIQSKSATTSLVTIQGVSTTRNALLAFTKRLESDSMFENVNLPVSNFAKDSNISFSLTLTAHPHE